MRDLLFEIGTEEIPAGFLAAALQQLETRFTEKAAELKIDHGAVKVMGTPRRLALLVAGVADKQEDIREELLGPSQKAGFDGDGNMTRAAIGFAKAKGADVSELKVVDTAKGAYLMLVREMAGRLPIDLLVIRAWTRLSRICPGTSATSFFTAAVMKSSSLRMRASCRQTAVTGIGFMPIPPLSLTAAALTNSSFWTTM